MNRLVRLLVLGSALVAVARISFAADPGGPVKVRSDRFFPLLMPSGTVWGVSVQALAEGRMAVCAVESSDGGATWSDRRTLVELPKVTPPTTAWSDGVPLIDKDQTFHYFVLRWDQSNKQASRPTLALWHLKAAPPYDTWTEPKLLFDGYIGALLSAVHTKSGTILSPFAYMTDRSYSQPAEGLMSYVYRGEHTSTAVYSTDGGETFDLSPTPVNVPASIIIGNENGAVEPVCLTLADGRTWMLVRTQRGRMWESFSDDGISWGEPRPSRFIASDSPAGLARLKDGRILAVWNCCQRYPYAHGGRQVLHAAISDDEGQTWHGFREVVRDPRRLEPALPIRGDYGTAYPIVASTSEGTVVFATGQGQSTGVYTLDPAWLTETDQTEDFSSGLERWSAYGTKGVELVSHPDRNEAKALEIKRVSGDLPAAAVWNFPNGRRGGVRMRFRLAADSGPVAIALTDHFSSPFDPEAESQALFACSVAPEETLASGSRLAADKWHELELAWDVRNRTCKASIDGASWKEMPQSRLLTEGVNYLRLHSLAGQPTAGGMLVESVSCHVELVGGGIAPADLR